MIPNVISIVLNFLGALALLLWGMDLLSSGIQKGAGSKLQSLLSVVSGNRFTAVLTGLVVTGIIQSSSATTVMVVSFVNAEILSLTQAIGIIFGANIGTTVTAWIVSLLGFSFDISAFAIPLIGFGFFIKKKKNWKIHNFGDMFMGFGMLFLGLDLLGKSLTFNESSIAFIQSFSNLGFLGIIVGVLIGVLLTALIHSSSAFTAIVLTMAHNNTIGWELSAALVFGSNIGTTIDAILSALGASTNAKRAAAVHVGFNICGTIIALIFFTPFLALVDLMVPKSPAENITNHIAMLHTVFNICSTIIFLPFVNHIAMLVSKLIKDSAPASEDEHYKLPVIISKMRGSVDLYVMQIEREIAKMAGGVMNMLDEVSSALESYDEKNIEAVSEKIFKQENYIDEMNESITDFLMKCFKMSGSETLIQKKIGKLLDATTGIEALSDECASIIYILKKYVENNQEKSSSYKKLLPYMNQVKNFFDYISQRLIVGLTFEEKQFSAETEAAVDKTQKELRKLARHRIEEGKDVKSELQYIDLVRRIENAGDCVYGIVKAL